MIKKGCCGNYAARNYEAEERKVTCCENLTASIYDKRKCRMRQDVWKCFFVGMLCFWLLWDVIEIKKPIVRIEEGILKEEEAESDREILKGEDFDWGDCKLYFNKRQYLDIHIAWIAKGCILLLVCSLIKRTQ